MPLYTDKLLRKQNRKLLKQKIVFNTKFYWFIIKNKIGFNPLFTDYINNVIIEELEAGKKEIRFYMDDSNNKYESLLLLHEWYCHNYGKDGQYSQGVFDAVYQSIHDKFKKYTDIRACKCEDEDGEFIMIYLYKKKEER